MRLYTLQDLTGRPPDNSDSDLTLRAVLGMTDLSAEEVDKLAGMLIGQEVTFDGGRIILTRTQ